MGLYYSFFHLAIALMCVHPSIKFEDLPNFPIDYFRGEKYGFKKFKNRKGKKYLTHKELEAFLDKCKQEKLISNEIFSSFLEAKELRWITNYAPRYDNYSYYDDINKILISRMLIHFKEIFFLILSLNKDYNNTAEKHDLTPSHGHDYLPGFIGDGIGDDFMDSFLSKEESEEVVKILLGNGLST